MLLAAEIFSLRQKRPSAVGKKAAMTIAIGMPCYRGVIVAADTQIAIDYTAQKGSKLIFFKGKSGAFAIAFASDDVNASRTLINRIQRKLEATPCADAIELESIVCSVMADWSAAYVHGIPLPSMELILSSRLINDGARLYFCQPPATFVEQYAYVGAGIGTYVTNPLNTTLFGFADCTEVQAALRRVAYLMYRAKKDTTSCGKSTYCVVVSWNCDIPSIVNHLDFEIAEKYATELDFLFHSTSSLYLGGEESALETNAQGIADMFKGCASFRTVQFHGVDGQVIKL